MSQTLTGVNTGYAGQCTAPSPGDLVTANSIIVGEQALLDDAQYLYETKADRAGDTITGAYTFQDTVTFEQPVDIINPDGGLSTGSAVTTALGGPVQMTNTVHMTSTCKTTLDGRVIPRSARVAVADATPKKLGVRTATGVDYAGKRFALPASQSGNPNVLTLEHTNSTPDEGETMEAVWTSSSFGVNSFEFRREDASVIANFVASSDVLVTRMFCWAEFEFVSGVWRLGANSGFAIDTVPLKYGVIPGASA